MNAVISTEVDNIEGLKKQLAESPKMEGLELASMVSTKEPYFFGNENATYKVAALDIGIKRNILKNLADRDAYIKVFPYNTTFEEMKEFQPDGYFLSNGHGISVRRARARAVRAWNPAPEPGPVQRSGRVAREPRLRAGAPPVRSRRDSCRPRPRRVDGPRACRAGRRSRGGAGVALPRPARARER